MQIAAILCLYCIIIHQVWVISEGLIPQAFGSSSAPPVPTYPIQLLLSVIFYFLYDVRHTNLYQNSMCIACWH
jgi:hypothetical protein